MLVGAACRTQQHDVHMLHTKELRRTDQPGEGAFAQSPDIPEQLQRPLLGSHLHDGLRAASRCCNATARFFGMSTGAVRNVRRCSLRCVSYPGVALVCKQTHAIVGALNAYVRFYDLEEACVISGLFEASRHWLRRCL